MSITRAARRQSFTALDNAVFQSQLSFRAMGLLAYLLSKPDHWQVSVAQLVKYSADTGHKQGRDAVYAILRELIAAGFVVRHQRRGEGGQLGGADYEVFDFPQPPCTAEPDTAEPHTGYPDTAEPCPANPTLVNTDLQQRLKEEVNTEDNPSRALAEIKYPDGLNALAWEEYLVYRKEARFKRLTERGKAKQITFLLQYDETIQRHIIDTTIANGWQGLFPPKGGQGRPAGGSRHQRTQAAIDEFAGSEAGPGHTYEGEAL